MAKQSILFISTQLPYPPKSGGTIKSWNYISHLTKQFDVGLACFLKEDDNSHLAEFKTKLQLKDCLTESLNMPRNIFSLVGSYLFSNSLNLYRNRSASFRSKVNELSVNYDMILIDHYEMFQYVPANYSGKVIVHTHNAEFALWQRMAELSANPLIKLALNMESRRVKNYESKIFRKADLVYATPSDIESFKEAGINSEKFAKTYHLGNEELLYLPAIEYEQTEKSLVFMGTLSWEPNIDGLLWFIEEVYPSIIEKHPDLKLYVLGKQSDDRLSKLSRDYSGIHLCGFIEDIDQYLRKSRVFIAPLRFGSGMKVKVLEGMYRGLPMVTTEVGAEGLEVKNEQHMIITDDATEYAKSCIRLIEDKDLWMRLSESSRKLASDKYTWEPLFKEMDEALGKL
ncbi:MAG: glycosyl transferase [Flavobacteriales bacterium]|nr:glycosyl transferase [Flavobacteriales bacterium]